MIADDVNTKKKPTRKKKVVDTYVKHTECDRFMKNSENVQEMFTDSLTQITATLSSLEADVGQVKRDLPLMQKDISTVLKKIDSYNNFRERVATLEGKMCSKDGDLSERVATIEQEKKDNVIKTTSKNTLLVAVISSAGGLLVPMVTFIILLLTHALKLQ